MSKDKEPIFPKGKDELDVALPLERELETRDPKVDEEADLRAAMQEELEAMRHKIDPDYRAKNRATFLRSARVEKRHSPANRVAINRPKGDPHVYRFNSDAVRDRIGMEGWVPVSDLEKAKKICPSAHLRVGADNKIYSGDSYLCEQPEENVELRNIEIFQRSEMAIKAAEDGRVAAGHESFSEMHERTRSSEDPVGIRMSGRLSEDEPSS